MDFVIRKKVNWLIATILCICVIICSLQILWYVLISPLGFKTERHRAGGIMLVLGLRVWPKVAWNCSQGPNCICWSLHQPPNLGDHEVRRLLSVRPHL